jgi:hypothetical protein
VSELSPFVVSQGLSKKFYHWKCCIAALAEQGRQLPPLKLSFDKMNKSQMLKALCSLETNEVGTHSACRDSRATVAVVAVHERTTIQYNFLDQVITVDGKLVELSQNLPTAVTHRQLQV